MNDILKIPFAAFNYNWEDLQLFLKHRGNPPYIITDELFLYKSNIESLGNLTSVGGNLYLLHTNIQSLGNLTSVGSNLYLENTPLSEKYSKEEIREMVEVGGVIYL